MQEEISFGGWLRKQRRALDLSRQALADQVGCAEVTLRRIEAGTLKPSKELASLLLEKVGIPEAGRSRWISFARGLSGLPGLSTPSTNKPITNLPAPLTTFIGREKGQADVRRLIARHRLVTLTGPGGVGKTRLSIKVGEQIAGDYPDGVWLVELAPIQDPSLVPAAVARTFGLLEDPKRVIMDILCDYLRDKTLLLILDNCEHVLDACAQFADTLLKRCPSLKILTTSREVFGVLGEAVYPVPSLELPDIRRMVDKFREYESIRLFEERAQLAQVNFSVTIENASSVAKICTQLDGIPLAIELAAARISTFSTEEIAERLRSNFSLLTTGNRTALPRHQTLHAAINWSYDLLSESERVLLRRLSIFSGGWIVEASEEVCSGDGIEPDEVLDLLTQLFNKSLVISATTSKSGNSRYRMLETIHQYAHEKLLDDGVEEILRNRHLAYFVWLVELAESELYRSNQMYWSNRLDDELDNFRIALEWALATDVESGLRIASLPWLYWVARGYLQEMGEWLAQLLERYHNTDELHARALAIYSYFIWRQENFSEAIRIAEQSLQMAHALADRHTEAFCLSFLGFSTMFLDMREGARLLEQSLALYRVLGDKFGQATTMEWLSLAHLDLDRTITIARESLVLNRELGNLAGIASCLTILARSTIWSGDLSSPFHWLEEALSLYRQIGDQEAEATVILSFGTLAYWLSDYRQANVYFEEAIRLTDKPGDNFINLWAQIFMAYAILRQGNIQQARQILVDRIGHSQNRGITHCLVFAVEGLASLEVNHKEPERAAWLFAWADTMREKTGNRRPPIEQASIDRDIAVIRSQLDELTFENACVTGRAMTQEQVIETLLVESRD